MSSCLKIVGCLLFICSLTACQSPQPTPTESPTPTATAPVEHLDIVEFSLLVTEQQGEETVTTLSARGDENGRIALKRMEQEEQILQVNRKGEMTFEGDDAPSLRLNSQGLVMVGNDRSPLSVTKEGAISLNGITLLKRAGDEFVPTNQEKSTRTIEVSGPPEAGQLSGLILAASLLELFSEPETSTTPTPDPTGLPSEVHIVSTPTPPGF